MRLVFWIQMFYGIPSVLLYIIVTALIIKNKKHYTGSFSKIFVLSTGINLGVFLNTVLVIRVPNNTCIDCFASGFYSDFPLSPILSLFQCLSFQYAFCQFSVVLITCANRLTVIWIPHEHEKLWDFLFYPIALITLFGPFVFTFDLLIKPAKMVFRETLGAYYMQTVANTGAVYFQLVIFDTIIIVITTAVNCLSIVLHGMREKNLSQNNGQLEKSLFRISVCSFVIQFVVGVMTVLLYKQAWDVNLEQSLTVILRLTLPYVSDLLTLSNPWLMIAFNRSIRTEIIGIIRRKNQIGSRNISTIVSQTPRTLEPRTYGQRRTLSSNLG